MRPDARAGRRRLAARAPGGAAPPPAPAPPAADPDRSAIEAALARACAAVRDAERRREQHAADWHAAAVELALTIAARLFHDEVTAGRFPVDAVVRELVGPLAGSPALRVFVNPADLAALRARSDGAAVPPDLAARFAADPDLPRGDCRVEDGDQVAAASAAAQLRAIRDELLGSLGHAPD